MRQYIRLMTVLLGCGPAAAQESTPARSDAALAGLPPEAPELHSDAEPEPPLAGLIASGAAEAHRRAFEFADDGRVAAAIAALPSDAEPLMRTLMRWVAFTNRDRASFAELARFIEEHPNWPRQGLLRRRAETALELDTPRAAVLDWFAAHPPATGYGRLVYAAALLDEGRHLEGLAWLREGWRNARLPMSDERRILRRYGELLTKDDHAARIDYLLWQRARSEAARLFDKVPKDIAALARARAALIAFSWNVDGAIARVPEHLQNDAGLIYDRAYWRRIKGKHAAARTLLLTARVDGSEIERPDRWWRERHFQARRALRRGLYDDAYGLAARHGMLDGFDTGNAEDLEEAAGLPRRARAQISEAEWLAGWIALRFLNRPADALRHFETMYSVVGLPVSLARGAYWAGRAAEALGDGSLAAEWYETAAAHKTTFYGQLALERAGGDIAAIADAAAVPDAGARAAFSRRELVRAAQLLAALGAERELHYVIRHLTARAGTPGEKALVAELAEQLERPQVGVIAAKTALRDGALIVERGYPVIGPVGASGTEASLIHAIARQESQFDPAAVSHVGAMGLMQLMPGTAYRVARQLAYPYSKERLLADARYNLTLGSAYFAALLERFSGSPILALAAYNAGPGAVERWLRDYGDPRDMSADIIDWIELIPYSETRNYVQRVLEAAPIYAMRLEAGAPEHIGAFMALGRDGPGRPVAPALDAAPRLPPAGGN